MLEGPGGPGGPTGPGRRAAKGGKGDPAAIKRAKRRKRINWIVAGFAVVVMMAGAGVVGLTWFYDDVPTYNTEELQATTIVYEDGKTQLAKLGEVNRTLVPHDKISEVVKHAVVAAEDKNFQNHEGIDLKGIARAAWNNFTGGDTQGASTITQQYARHAADLSGINYNRKIREAVLARKLEQDYDKDQILGFYLNAIYFGRGAYGIEAAAQSYFGKSVLVQPGQKNALTKEEAAVLAAVIKQPEPDKVTGHKGYDPQTNPEAAKDRWGYTLNNMVEKNWMTAEERAKAAYPEKTLKEYNPKLCNIGCGADKPTGNVINYVRDELEAMGIPAADWKKGGYRITTTINQKAQKAAEDAARNASKVSPMNKLPKHYRAALVAVDPTNGRVLAYYGGENGTGYDYAGLNEGGKSGGHAPGSTFKIYTLAAALRAEIPMDSRWDATKDDDNGRKISNAGREANQISCGKNCTLEQSTISSFNVPFYWIADSIGPHKVVEAARDAGIRTMFDTSKGQPHDLTSADPKELAPTHFDNEVAFGQYPITVLDHANGVATLANRGVYNKAHFIVSVEKRGANGQFVKVAGKGEKLAPEPRFVANQIDDINAVLQKIPGNINNKLDDGRPATGKTGTWELNQERSDNGDAWMVGATPQVAAAVWVGTEGQRRAIKEANGRSNMTGSGTPAAIWELFMDRFHKDLGLEVKRFEERKNTGDPDSPYPNGVAPPPPPPTPGNNNCGLLPDILCPDRDRDRDRDRDNNGNGNQQPNPGGPTSGPPLQGGLPGGGGGGDD
ncbi:transglycosylase domain-containing protein [Phytohabitans kaempferiae]|uniref:transglycosylase domain-containing protein n=1 Tax=Phytohabitans kaempferiae TaxID=1620943 RepID=UPI00366B7805